MTYWEIYLTSKNCPFKERETDDPGSSNAALKDYCTVFPEYASRIECNFLSCPRRKII